MKRLLAIIMCILITVSTVACALTPELASEPAVDPQKAKSEAQYACGKAAYEQLNIAADICVEMMDGIYEAWRFAILDADDYYNSTVVLEFASEVGFTKAEIEEAYIDAFSAAGAEDASLLPYMLKESFSIAVTIVKQAYVNNGTVQRLDDALASAKSELKTMTQEYSDYSEYPNLKSYYSQVSSYAEFAKNPSGSFEQLKTTIESYEREIRTYRSDMSFVFED